MDSSKIVGGVNSKYSKVYVVCLTKRVMYLFDIALWDTSGEAIYNKNKMINYISKMIKTNTKILPQILQ